VSYNFTKSLIAIIMLAVVYAAGLCCYGDSGYMLLDYVAMMIVGICCWTMLLWWQWVYAAGLCCYDDGEYMLLDCVAMVIVSICCWTVLLWW